MGVSRKPGTKVCYITHHYQFVQTSGKHKVGTTYLIVSIATAIFLCQRVHLSVGITDTDFPEVLPHDKMKEYLELYCEHNVLKQHIKFGYEVMNLDQMKDDRWQVTTQSAKGTEQWTFDKVILASGRHQTPLWPKVENLEKFKGEIIHAEKCVLIFVRADVSYKRPEPFRGKTVLVVGIGNTGLDCAVDLSYRIAKQVYISGRGFYL
jgi:cation diffusion facilitator CzcD-associated flavoprotein CzcO